MDAGGVGMATDLALIATRGQVIDRGAYLVALTPDDPGYHQGNLVVLPRPLQRGELAWSLGAFAREVAAQPGIRHVALRWTAPVDAWTAGATAPATDELITAGFTIDHTLVMLGQAPRPAAPPPGIELRPLAPDELARAAELGFADAETHDEAYRQLLHRRAGWQRDLVARGMARFWGAFDDRTLVASLGVVRLGAGARYQDVQTAVSHRGRGIAAALLAVAGREATRAGATQLVIMTAAGSAAERVYARAGFRTIERIVSVLRLAS